MVEKIEKRGDKMADQTGRNWEDPSKKPVTPRSGAKGDEENYKPSKEGAEGKDKDKKADEQSALDRLVKIQETSFGVYSPSKEDSEAAEKALYHKEEEKDDVKTIVSSISEDRATKAAAVTVAEHVNLRQSLDGVPGVLNLTAGGTLNNDGTTRLNKTIEELNQMYEDIAGPNPMPNRIGNELTKSANILTTSTASHAVMENKDTALELDAIIAKTTDDKDKKTLEKAKSGLSW